MIPFPYDDLLEHIRHLKYRILEAGLKPTCILMNRRTYQAVRELAREAEHYGFASTPYAACEILGLWIEIRQRLRDAVVILR